MGKPLQLAGQRFGRWWVLSRADTTKNGDVRWLCRCDCGVERPVIGSQLKEGTSRSCGCLWKENLVGRVYGGLSVESFHHVNERGRYWLCRCICGNTTIVQTGNLMNGSIRSCGCARLEAARQAREKIPNLLTLEESAKRAILHNYKTGAKARELSWNISDDEFLLLTRSSCFYCGIPPSNTFEQKRGRVLYNGVDRKDSGRGYSSDNLVSCCWVCNKMKGDIPFQDFVSQIQRISEHLSRATSEG